jgi:hypothetical protein
MFLQYQRDPLVNLLLLGKEPGHRCVTMHLFNEIFYLLFALPIWDVPDERDHAIGIDIRAVPQ